MFKFNTYEQVYNLVILLVIWFHLHNLTILLLVTFSTIQSGFITSKFVGNTLKVIFKRQALF